jgi:hypothetical protein
VTTESEQYPFVMRDQQLGAASFAPFLPITLVSAKSVELSCLLDTGATVNVLPYIGKSRRKTPERSNLGSV